MNSKPVHFLLFMNNGKIFPSVATYHDSEQLRLLPGYYQAKSYWVSWDLQQTDLLENETSKTRNNMKSQINNK